MSNRTAYIILVILLLNIIVTYVFEKHFTKAPLSTDISLAVTSQESHTIFVPMSQTYSVEILFSREGKEFEYLQETLGPMIYPEKKGLPLTVEWSLSSKEKTIKTVKSVTDDSCGWSNTHVYRCLGSFQVPKGEYIFTIKPIEVSRELSKFKTTTSINYNFKNAHTWQTAYVFWGWLFNLFIAPIIGGIIMLVLLTRLYKHLTSRSSGTTKKQVAP